MSRSARLARAASFVAALCSFAVAPAFAAWPSDALHPLRVCPSIGHNIGAHASVPDGANGVLFAWEDQRGADIDIYAQHVLADGSLDPAWPALGVPLCTAASNQQVPKIVSDGAGGAFVTWMDMGSDWDIHAQHVLGTGVVDPRWPANGVAVGVGPGLQAYPVIARDGGDGVYIAWFDYRVSPVEIYTLRLHGDGSIASGWAANGSPLCAVPNASQQNPDLVADGSGGVIVAWEDARGTLGDNGGVAIVAQHLLASGSVDAAWPPDGLAISARAYRQEWPRIATDGAGGAIVTWQDARASSAGVLAQHVLASGVTDPAWPDSGRVLCSGDFASQYPVIAPDGGGGAFVSWMDDRNGANPLPNGALAIRRAAGRPATLEARMSDALLAATDWDVYAAHVEGDGSLDPAWPANGFAVCRAARNQWFPVIAGDGLGAAYIAFQDFREDVTDGWVATNATVHRVRAGMGVDPAWPVDGQMLAGVPGFRYAPALTVLDAGSVVCGFGDSRVDAPGLYTQRLSVTGAFGDEQPVPTLASLVAAEVADGVVRLRWNAPDARGGEATLERRDETSDWSALATLRIDGTGGATYDDRDVAPGARVAYRLAFGVDDVTMASWIDVPAASGPAIRVRNPIRDGALDVAFTAPDERPVAVELFDVGGRRVAVVHANGSAGARRVSLANAAALEPGVYLVRVGLAHPVVTRVAVVR